jgi:hypothetical protein
MTYTTHTKHLKATAMALAAAAAAAIAGCGGGQPADDTRADVHAVAAAATVPALVDDQGLPMPPVAEAVPADAGARTRSTGYATPAQAQAMEDAMGADLMSIDVGCCSLEGADLAVLMVYGQQAARDLPSSAPVLVSGTDQRFAATVAQRLADAGFSRVWLVVR